MTAAPRLLDAATLVADLTEAQRGAVTSDAAPLCVLAAAGSGKTRVLTRRVAYRCATGTADAGHVLALTFTRRAAGELAGRLRALGLRDRVATGTFHAVAAAQLRRWWADRGQAPPALLDRKARLLAPLAAERPALAGVPLAELAGHLEWFQARGVSPEAVEAAVTGAGRRLPVPAAEMAGLYARYDHEKRRRGLVDFDDLLARCADALEGDATFAAAQRWRWRHVFVDEFQDLNPLQHRLLLAWLGDRLDLCVVGDPHQAIYGWNGADPQLLDGVPARWPTTQVVRLDTNFRCSPPIVAAGAALLGGTAGLRSARDEGAAVAVRRYPSGDHEARGVARELRAAHTGGLGWASMAVLTRTNAQAVLIAETCRGAGVPVRVPGRRGLLEHPSARQALARLGERPGAPVAVAGADLAAWAGSVIAGGPVAGTEPEAAEVMAALAELARQAEQLDPATTVGGWLADLPALLGPDAGPEGADAVTACSFHRAKGLEWPAVWICGLEEHLVPIAHATTPAAIAEERRLLYVAVTRAADHLVCSWAGRRRFGDRTVPRLPSPWLAAIEAAGSPSAGGRTAGTAESAPGPSPEEWQATMRDRLGRPPGSGRRRSRLPAGWPPPDGRVLEALRAWRAATARASAVPPHVVLHDTILEALASARPADQAGLLAIPGLGPVKASRYGPALLHLVATTGLTPADSA